MRRRHLVRVGYLLLSETHAERLIELVPGSRHMRSSPTCMSQKSVPSLVGAHTFVRHEASLDLARVSPSGKCAYMCLGTRNARVRFGGTNPQLRGTQLRLLIEHRRPACTGPHANQI